MFPGISSFSLCFSENLILCVHLNMVLLGISDFRMAGIGTSRVISFNLVSGMIMEMAANSSTLAWKIP